MITAKIVCHKKTETGVGEQRQIVAEFQAKYANGENEWAVYTPQLSLSMTLKGVVGDQFAVGKAYTLTFEEDSAE